MFSRSTWLHLRVPFSFFLLPVFLFSLCLSPNATGARIFWVFIILHFFLYPASNGYNSYFDRDEESIGGLRRPPKVQTELYGVSLALDAVAILLGIVFVNWMFAIMLFVYGLVSKAYSHPSVRLKKLPIVGWLAAGFFQGCFTFIMCYIGINDFTLDEALTPKPLYAGLLTTCMLLGSYPMTQVYQHHEDARRGDMTISRLVGISGTFWLSGVMFLLVLIGFTTFFGFYFSAQYSVIFAIAMFPMAIYFVLWYLQVRHDKMAADYSHTMRLNFVSATSLNVFFLFFFIASQNAAGILTR
ncbi:MAG TPA: UbiA family prenyltransferase [Cyclobacteriaceae bacterium]|nr:UbiA family prenyltransferase [Cyclobacteriaceae bacterium]